MKAAHPLRALTAEEARALQRTAKATSERSDVVQRARALRAVRAGQGDTHAARAAGYQSGDSVSQLVERFNEQGLAALRSAGGRGRNVLYTLAQRERILTELQRVPERAQDGTATWSLKLLERALRHADLPQVSATTIRTVLQEAGYRYTKSRTWCATGTALRVRQGETVPVQDPKAQEKNRCLSGRTKRRKRRDARSGARMKPVPIRLFPNQGPVGTPLATRPSSRLSISVAERPNC